jgi:hypothetical protein
MPTKPAKTKPQAETASVAELNRLLSDIEQRCRHARLLMQQLDPETRIPLTPEIEALRGPRGR